MDERLVAYLSSIGVGPKALRGWKIAAAQRDGQDVGFVLTKGSEIHILPTVEGKAMSRRNVLEAVTPILKRHGYCTTRTPLSVTDHKLRRVLGFTPQWADDQFQYWCMTELPFQRKHP